MVRLFAGAALLFWSAQAAVPQALDARAATCNRDNCFREVFGTQYSTRPAQGASDCTSYLRKTVSPCAVTSTSTFTTSKLGGVAYATVTSTSTAPAVSATTTQVITTFATTTPTTSVTVTTIATATATTTVTVNTTVTANKKRDVLEARTITSSCPATTSAAAAGIPKYASDCTGTRFSSVCSCNGNVPTAATTLPASTSVVTTTTTSLFTTASTITSTVTVTPTTTGTATSTTTVTVTAPVTTSTITATSTTTTTTTTMTTTTTTTTAAQPAQTCTNPYTLIEGCQDGTQCETPKDCKVTTSDGTCADLCNANSNCLYYQFDPSNNNCDLFYECCNGR